MKNLSIGQTLLTGYISKVSLGGICMEKRTERLTEILIRCKIKKQCFEEQIWRDLLMRIGAVGFQPYIYNTNYLSGNSLGRVSAIGDDLLASRTDYSALLDEDLNENPLRKGETSNFVDILQMQFHTGRMNASRLIRPAEEAVGVQIPGKDEDEKTKENLPADSSRQADGLQNRNLYLMQRAAKAYGFNMTA